MKAKRIESLYFFISIFTFTFYLLTFLGCATAPYVELPKPEGLPGTYHRVEAKETLWRISEMYRIELEELIKINHISDASQIEIGQLIFIPGEVKSQTPSVNPKQSEDFIWPAKGKVISSFGQASSNMINKGIHIETYKDAEVVASRTGRVIFYSPSFNVFGKTIIIDHGDGLSTVYARNSEVFVKIGDEVQRGVRIAKVGQAGRDKNSYLHFEIRKRHIPQNPYFYLP
ncbi:MAG: LysM peptidoglycan-binding domain-containing M23 family metallopeptidase [Candidatus Omnitrophica bacterium]|nr:LysM peptidoglycan-binding domain-containing M23 family metallopeptidase [Candidatus Omnitrophota bacterium]